MQYDRHLATQGVRNLQDVGNTDYSSYHLAAAVSVSQV